MKVTNIALSITCTPLLLLASTNHKFQQRPNILLVISDDQGWPHASAYGSTWIKTPTFDQLANDGALFNNAFVSAPSSAPSRLSFLTGRHFYQNQEGGVHGGFIPSKFPLFTDILAEHNYVVGYTGKGCGPFGKHKEYGIQHDPLGKPYNKLKFKDQIPVHSFGNLDYEANFEAFLRDNSQNSPFCFMFNCWEPHRPYFVESAKNNGNNPSDVELPAFLPDVDVIRNEVNDYGFEIEWYDQQLGKIIKTLKEKNLYDNTIIVVTSDNGMPFQNAKMHCYEYGLHVPFLVVWKGNVASGQVLNDLISTTELASFFLQAANLPVPLAFNETSLPKVLNLKGFHSIKPNKFIVGGKEKHNPARENNLSYPIRIIRNKQFLLVHNLEPNRWPAGDVPYFKDLLWDKHETGILYEMEHQNDSIIAPFFRMHTQKRPEYELFDILKDPFCLVNLAENTKYKSILTKMRVDLHKKLKADGDPRMCGLGECFESTPTSFSNPIDDLSQKTIFKNFPQKGKYTNGIMHFDHSNDAVDSVLLRKNRY